MHALVESNRKTLTAWASIVDFIRQISLLFVSTSVRFDLLNLLDQGVQLSVNSCRRFIQLHQHIKRTNLKLTLVDL